MIPVLAGQIPDFDLPQIISMVEYGRLTGCLRVLTPRERGLLHFSEGHLTTAETGDLRAELAAIVILSWPEGTFSFLRGVEPGRPPEMRRSNQSLLLEAMRLIDESRTSPVFMASRKAKDAPLAGTAKRLVASLSTRAMSLPQLADASDLSRLEAYYHLEMLEEQGLVKRVDLSADTLPVTTDARIRVLIIDDSNLMQKALTRLYESDPSINVVGTAGNGQEGLAALARLKPDVVSLDLYMPVMDGVTALKHIMLSQPTPTVVVTAANPESLDLTFESILRFGAIDFITKPSKSRGDIEAQTHSILTRLKKAAKVNLRGLRMVQPPATKPGERASRGRCQGVVIAAAGTGACLSYMQVLTSLPADLPLALIGVLPFPDDFLRAFVSFLSKSATFSVETAEDGKPLESGVCYLVGSEQTVRIVPSESGPSLAVVPKTGFLSVSTLMAGAARIFAHRSVGLVLSGGGDDVIEGLAAIRAAGGITLAQLPASCVDPEQPELAIQSGLVDRTVLPNHLSGSLSQLLMSRLMKSTSETTNVEEMVKTCPEESASPYR